MNTAHETIDIPAAPKTIGYQSHNAKLNLIGDDGKIQFDEDRQAVRQYFLEHVNMNTVFFHDLEEKLTHHVRKGYYDQSVLDMYTPEFVKALFKQAYAHKHRFATYLGAMKFYTSYALKTNDGQKYLERFEDRVTMTALGLATGDTKLAKGLVDEIITGRFQPATPTFLNSGKAQRGELVSCFPGDTLVDTSTGQRRIDEIATGDHVLSHDGAYHRVSGVSARDYEGDFVQLTITGAAKKISATPEHPFLVHRSGGANAVAELEGRDGATANTVWVAAKDIRPGDMVIAGYSQAEGAVAELRIQDFLRAPERYSEKDGFLFKLNKDPKVVRAHGQYARNASPIRDTIQLSGAFGRFVGYYLSEGYVMTGTSGRAKGVNFTFGSTELGFIADVAALAADLFGLTAKTKTNRDGSTNVYINSLPLGEFIRGLTGSGFDQKALPDVFMHTNEGFQRELLIGAYRGDGCTTGSSVVMSLTNPQLIQQLKQIALRCGMLARSRDYESQSGRIAGELAITGYPGTETDFILDVDKDVFKFVGAAPHHPTPSAWVDGYPAYRVRAAVVFRGAAPVYNLHVDETHTYSVEGFIVHNCFLLRVEDNMESIARAINSSLQLSKRGGGVALNLTNLRELGAPIKRIEGQSSGVVPVMKQLEVAFQYANQLGARQGAGAVYLSAHHPDIMRFLDTKRENADESVRIKSLSLGVVIPDITYHLASQPGGGGDMHLFSPYDVERIYGVPFSDISITEKYEEMVANPDIKKSKIKARDFFTAIAELQFESGYPYIVNEDTVNAANPIDGRINMSNLCSEILQVNTPTTYHEDLSYDHIGRDISCNLGSMNIALAMDGGDLASTIDIAIRGLSAVSDQSHIRSVRSIEHGNDLSHAIGLGQMNLHGYLGRERIHYGSTEAIDFTNMYFYTVLFHALTSSNKIAREREESFYNFEKSTYADGSFFTKYTDQVWAPATKRAAKLFADAGVAIPTQEDWVKLSKKVQKHGLYNQNLQAVPPTGSISYINHSTSSIHPIAALIEVRKEGKLGRAYYPAPFLTNENIEYFTDAYEIGPEKIIATYAAATQHVDQGLSLTLFFKDTATTRDVTKAAILAWKSGIKTQYYVRLRQTVLDGTESEGCVSCAL